MRQFPGLSGCLLPLLICCCQSLTANAAVVTLCPGTPQITDREFSITTSAGATCIGSSSGNINGNGDAINALGYVTIDKSDNATVYVGADGELTLTGAGTLSGTFSFSPPAGYQKFVLAFKSGQGNLDPDWVAFLLPAGVLSGSWNILSGTQELSHANLYGIAGVAQTPIPGALWLMGSVLAGWLGVGRWRQSRAC
jgi:hypothetical protein